MRRGLRHFGNTLEVCIELIVLGWKKFPDAKGIETMVSMKVP